MSLVSGADRKKVLVIGATAHSLVNFRGDLIKALVASDCDVIAMAGDSDQATVSKIRSLGAGFESYPVSRTSIGILNNLKTFLTFRSRLNAINPDIVLSYTIKPVIWTGCALRRMRGIKFYALVTGRGYAFDGSGLKRSILKLIVSALYKCSLRRASQVIFQNEDDRQYFCAKGITNRSLTSLVNGSGVSTEYFAGQPLPSTGFTFLMVARLLGQKGVRVYCEAARLVKERYPDTVFQLLGPFDQSPDRINPREVDVWEQDGLIQYLGQSDDVRPFLKDAHVFVLPSYYKEGLPRTILEAMSVGRPILTTNNVGCREPVNEGLNGWLVPVKDAFKLSERMVWFIENEDQLSEMAQESRRIVRENYDVDLVNRDMIAILGVK